ncbi:hypothetical protein KUCAC02_021223, partial [Chaenocephalus aceratus]
SESRSVCSSATRGETGVNASASISTRKRSVHRVNSHNHTAYSLDCIYTDWPLRFGLEDECFQQQIEQYEDHKGLTEVAPKPELSVYKDTSGPVKGMRCGNGWLRPMLRRTAKTLVSAPAYSSQASGKERSSGPLVKVLRGDGPAEAELQAECQRPQGTHPFLTDPSVTLPPSLHILQLAQSLGPRGLLLKRGSVQHLQIALHNHFLLPTHSSQAALCAKAQKSANRGVQSTQGLSTGPYSSGIEKHLACRLPGLPPRMSASDEGEKNDALYGHCKKPFIHPQRVCSTDRSWLEQNQPAQAHWRPVLEAGIEKVASVLHLCPTSSAPHACVKAGRPGQAKEGPKENAVCFGVILNP